jgi:hypothetical protein
LISSAAWGWNNWLETASAITVCSGDVRATRDTASLMIPLLIAVLALLAAIMLAVPSPDSNCFHVAGTAAPRIEAGRNRSAGFSSREPRTTR